MVMESKTEMLNFLLLILLALPILLLDRIGSPTERGFFIDDDSLSYPYKIDTVPNWLLYMMGFGIPIVLILLGNLSIKRSSSRENIFESLKHSYTMIILYLLGAAACQLQVAICKFTVGRLRPHFFDVCKPDFVKVENKSTPTYVMNYTCLGNPSLFSDEMEMDDHVRGARLSFPSGHSSFAFQAAVFTVLYLQTKYGTHGFQQLSLPIPFFQVIAISVATFTAVSRIMDYKHHPTDVLAGTLIGVTSQSLNFCVNQYYFYVNQTERTQEALDNMEISDSNNPLLDDEGRNDQDQLVTRRRMKGSYNSIVVEI